MNLPSISEPDERTAARVTLKGLVQGVGMRPAIARLAATLELAGFVRNTHTGVAIHIEGAAGAVSRFMIELPTVFPTGAVVIESRQCDEQPLGLASFEIDAPADNSAALLEGNPTVLSARVPTDIVTCPDCRRDVFEDFGRRRGYPFTSCVNCGPRYSIIKRMPFERATTTMMSFVLCNTCQQEYQASDDRRFHAQTTACPECGPTTWLRDVDDRTIASGAAAIDAAAQAILVGKIVALRGLGGYQLIVDATSQFAVERLRQRKCRLGKPFPVMVASVDDAIRNCSLSAAERRILCAPEGPILIAAARSDSPVAPAVTAGLNTLGLLLPTTPLHQLLVNSVSRPLVCTSGNIEGDPLSFESLSARQQLRDVADVWLEHDRPIQRPIDDSVVRVMSDRPVMIRLARGYAPCALPIDCVEPLIALGGEQKGAIALGNGVQSVLGPHIGDYATVAMRERFREQLAALAQLYGVAPTILVCDQHPEYFTTREAEECSSNIIRVQHHHAHIVAGMVEQGWLNRTVLGVAWDGTGYGADGTVWGGEFLKTTATGFQRLAYLRPFEMPGGVAAIRQPWRVAIALTRAAAGDAIAARLKFHSGDSKSILSLLSKPALSPRTTSAGRLFEGIAALIFRRERPAEIENCRFEGEAAMRLEAACDPAADGRYEMAIESGPEQELDWRPLVRQVLSDCERGIPCGTMAMRVHRGLAAGIGAMCGQHPGMPIVLGGGVFQNRILVELLAQDFAAAQRPVALPGLIPPNDGGLAVGQMAIANAVIRQRRIAACV